MIICTIWQIANNFLLRLRQVMLWDSQLTSSNCCLTLLIMWETPLCLCLREAPVSSICKTQDCHWKYNNKQKQQRVVGTSLDWSLWFSVGKLWDIQEEAEEKTDGISTLLSVETMYKTELSWDSFYLRHDGVAALLTRQPTLQRYTASPGIYVRVRPTWLRKTRNRVHGSDFLMTWQQYSMFRPMLLQSCL